MTQSLLAQLLDAIRSIARDLSKSQPPGNFPGTTLLQSLQTFGPQTVPQLARNRNTSRQSVQMSINRLARAGAVEWVSNPAHKRSDFVQLTEKGRTELTTFLAGEGRGLQISEKDARWCLELLRQVREMLSANEPGTGRKAEPDLKPDLRARKRKSEPVRAEPELMEETELPVSLL